MSFSSSAFFATMTAGLTALCVACTSVPADAKPDGIAAYEADPRLGEKVDRICFASSIDSFRSAGDDTVIIEGRGRQEYIVEVFGICQNLDFAQSIGIDSFGSCLTRGDDLIVSTSAFSLNDRTSVGPNRCRINAIYEWDEDAAEKTDTEDETIENVDALPAP